VAEADKFSIRVATVDDTPSNMEAAWSAAVTMGEPARLGTGVDGAAGPPAVATVGR